MRTVQNPPTTFATQASLRGSTVIVGFLSSPSAQFGSLDRQLLPGRLSSALRPSSPYSPVRGGPLSGGHLTVRHFSPLAGSSPPAQPAQLTFCLTPHPALGTRHGL